MIVKAQKRIEFINDCNAIVDYKDLEQAIYWYSNKPVSRIKHIYLHGSYPAISIYREKIHIHRLLMMFWLGIKLPREFSVHHINENKLDSSKENLCVILNSTHAKKHNIGKEISDKMKQRLIEFNHSRKNTKQPYHRPDINCAKVKELYDIGYSVNKIAKELKCDWSTVKARLNECFDNPELLEVTSK